MWTPLLMLSSCDGALRTPYSVSLPGGVDFVSIKSALVLKVPEQGCRGATPFQFWQGAAFAFGYLLHLNRLFTYLTVAYIEIQKFGWDAPL